MFDATQMMIVVGVLIMIFFGRGKISEMMGDMAKGIELTRLTPYAARYAGYPVDRWRNLFAAVTSQLDEAAGKAGRASCTHGARWWTPSRSPSRGRCWPTTRSRAASWRPPCPPPRSPPSPSRAAAPSCWPAPLASGPIVTGARPPERIEKPRPRVLEKKALPKRPKTI